MYTLTNLARDCAASKFINYNAVLGNENKYLRTVKFYVRLKTDIGQLDLQAKNFAFELSTRTNLYFRAIFNTPYDKTQKDRMERIYIYSFAKALFYGMYSGEIGDLPDNSPIFVGHGVLQRWIKYSEFSFAVGTDFTLRIEVANEQADLRRQFDKLVSIYPYLANCERTKANGEKSFRDDKLESYLGSLANAAGVVTDKRSQTMSNQQFIVDNNVEREDDEPAVDVKEKSNLDTGEVRYDRKRGNLQATEVPVGLRVVEIFGLDDPMLDSFVSDEMNCIANSAISSTNNNQWYYIFSPTHGVAKNLSYFLPRANFITLDNPEVSAGDSTYFDILPRNYSEDFLICEDIRAITYLNVGDCAFNSLIAKTVTQFDYDIVTVKEKDQKDTGDSKGKSET